MSALSPGLRLGGYEIVPPLGAGSMVEGGTFAVERPWVWFAEPLSLNTGFTPNFDLAPDGKRFVVLMPAERAGPQDRPSHVKNAVSLFEEIRRREAR